MFLNSLLKQKITFLLLIVFLLICNVSIKAQDTIPDKRIISGKLQWSDYTGSIDENSSYWANTSWYVHYKYSIIQFHGDTAIIDLQVWPALQEISWVLPDKKTDELLQHEQGHFDFGRLLALRFTRQADSTILLISNCSQKLGSLFTSIFSNIKQMEIQYDNETNHMLNKAEQKRWNKKIVDMLKAAE